MDKNHPNIVEYYLYIHITSAIYIYTHKIAGRLYKTSYMYKNTASPCWGFKGCTKEILAKLSNQFAQVREVWHEDLIVCMDEW